MVLIIDLYHISTQLPHVLQLRQQSLLLVALLNLPHLFPTLQ